MPISSELATFNTPVQVQGDITVSESMSSGGKSVLTTNTGYTKAEINTSLSGKQDALMIVTPVGGSNLLRSNILKGIRTNSPITLTDTNDILYFDLD
jgi:hypothetical protein